MADKTHVGEKSRNSASKIKNSEILYPHRSVNHNLLKLIKNITICSVENHNKGNMVQDLKNILQTANLPYKLKTLEIQELKSTFQKCQGSRIELINRLYDNVKHEDIRKIMVYYYLQLRSLSSLNNVFSKISNRQHCIEGLKIHLENLGFIFKQYPGTDKHFIVEKPENVLERVRYIKNMQLYRETNRNIIYLETTVDNLIIAVAPLIWYKRDYDLKDIKHLEFLLENSLISVLPINSVVVLSKYFRRKLTMMPTEYSSKRVMTEWLRQNEIPVDKNMHKAELYKLVKTYKNITKEKYYLEEILAGHGHTVIWKPDYSSNFTYEGILNKIFAQLDNNTEEFINTLTGIPLEMWKEYNDHIIKEENETLEEDILLTEIVDGMLISAKNGNQTIPGLTECISNAKEEFVKKVIVK